MSERFRSGIVHRICLAALLVGASAASARAGAPTPPGMARIPDGAYCPLFRAVTDLKEVPIKSFYLDVFPVRNEEFLEFIRANPHWRRSRVKRLFADENYLKHWSGDLEPGIYAKSDQPVVWISWFAAKAYAQWKTKRLPTVAEWECAAAASPTRPDGVNDAAYQRDILRWYTTPSPIELPTVGHAATNLWGVHDLHGLVWEWVADFNTAMVTGDARGDTGLERDLFCGGGSQGVKDTGNFPAFMRYGFRSSLKADYCVHNLGFRCAKDL